MQSSLSSTSKFLSLVLRHRPDLIGLTLDREGWASVDELIERASTHGTSITRSQLLEIVARNSKQRFALDAPGTRIRANQGHSIDVDLQLAPAIPPDRLFHGTAQRFVDSIRRDGIRAGTRQHVHLSDNQDTAKNVGSRHGKPCVLRIDATGMQRDGYVFYQSQNGVWLTDYVPSNYLLD